MDGSFEKTVQNMLALKEAALLTSAASLVLQDYVLRAPDMGSRRFNFFCSVFADSVTRSQHIDYYAAELALARRSRLKTNGDHPELFDEVRQEVFHGDAKGLEKLIEFIAGAVSEGAGIPSDFAARTHGFLKAQVSHYSFTDKEVASLQEKLATPAANRKLTGILNGAVAMIGEIQQHKRERDLNALNRWAFNFKSDDLLKKLSFRNTYVNLAYERLVREHEIKNIIPENYYRQHRLSVQGKIASLTGTFDAKGKQICRKYAINKAYKAIAGQDKFKLQSVLRALEKYPDESFYNDTAVLLTALDGGAKNRNIHLPCRPYQCYD